MKRLIFFAVLLLGIDFLYSGNLSLLSNRPENNVFISGEPVIFTVEGEGQQFTYRIENFWKKSVQTEVFSFSEDRFLKEVRFTSPETGYFEMEVNVLSQGKVVEKKRTTFAVITPPTEEMLKPEFRPYPFGLAGGLGKKALTGPLEDFNRYLGIRWAWSNSARWGGMGMEEKGKGKWDDRWIKPMTDDDYLRINPLVAGTPRWASRNPKGGRHDEGTLYPARWDDLKDYVRFLAGYFKKRVKLPRVYQVGNEHNAIERTKGSIKDEITYNAIVCEEIKKIDPEATVLFYFIGQQKPPSQKTIETLESGVLEAFDGVHLHYYVNGSPEKLGYAEGLDACRDLLKKYGCEKDIWLSEQGWNTHPTTGIKESDQANYIVRRTVIALSKGVKAILEFYAADYPRGYYGLFRDQQQYYGLVKEPRYGPQAVLPKPSFASFAFMTRVLTGAEFVQEIDYLGPTTLGYVFKKDGRPVIILWDYEEQGKEVRMEFGTGEVTVMDLMGNKKRQKTENGYLTITIGESPVYIYGASPEIFLNVQEMIKATSSLYTAFPGDRLKISLEMSNPFDRTVKGRMVFESPEGFEVTPGQVEINLPPRRKNVYVSTSLSIPDTASCRLYPVTARFYEQRTELARDILKINVTEPIVIEKILPVLNTQGIPSMQMTIRNRRGRETSGRILVSIRGIKKESTFQLSPESLFDIQVTEQNGFSISKRSGISFVPVKKAGRKITIDGNLDDWPVVEPVVLNSPSLMRDKTGWEGADDLSGNVYLSWDRSNLYLSIRVKDSVFSQEYTGFMTWAGDSIQVAFDPEPGEETVYDQITASSNKKITGCTLALAKGRYTAR